ncbi:MAG: hypothetical protein H7Z74_02175 [Anaerolineae bacterium]|nr:hypothetical protein [Gemmatimonadaceae bacterium]
MLGRSAIFLVLALMLPAAHAEIVTFRATGTISIVDSNDGFLPIIGRVGDAYTLDYSFDTQTPGRSGSWYDGALTQVTLQVGASTISVPLGINDIVVANDSPSMAGMLEDFYRVQTDSVGDSLRTSLSLSLYTIGWQPTLLTGNSLSSEPPDISLARSRGFGFSVSNGPSGGLYRSDSFSGDIESLTRLTPVPVPAAAWLLVSGLVFLRRFSSPDRRPDQSTAATP